MSKQHCGMLQVECRCFAIVAVFGNSVAGFGNKVECCFDIVAGVDGALLYVIVGECDVR